MYTFNTFMGRVAQDNPSFKKWARHSSLDALIQELQTNAYNTAQGKARIEKLAVFLPFAKQTRYTRTLAYLRQELGIHVGAVPANATMEFVKFMILPGTYRGYNGTGGTQNIPLNPHVDGSPGPRSFVHRHKLSWTSSNGNPPSLAQVRTREYVKFLTDTQAPPFNNIQDPDREFYHPGNMGSVGGTYGEDDHSTKLPALICCYPRQAGSLHGQQKYQYSVDNGVTWHDMENGQFLLEKTVRQDGNDWVFTFKKTNWAPHNSKRFHFEVEYTIGAPPAYLPRAEADVVKVGFAEDADIDQYARRVISRG